MAQTIKLKRSAVSGNTPSTSDLALGEIGINTFDGKIFMKKNDGTESVIEVGGSSGTVTSAFKTIAVAGQSNVVADSATDTLTFVAGTNMSITTSAGGDSVTFASTGSSGSDTFLGLSDSPANFTNAAGKYLKVNSAANALEYDTLTFSDIGSTPTSLSGYGITDSLQIGTSSTTALAGNTSIPTVLTDLTIADGSGGQVLQTNGSGSFSFTDQSGGNAFKTISVAGQSDVVADSASDTLTVVAGNNITLSTNPGGDSITIASTASGSNLSSSFNLFEYVATSNQTTFSGADSNSNTLAYDVGAGTVLAKVFVYYNGILLDHTTDYTATNGTSVVLTSGVVTGDTIQIGAYVSSVSVSADIALSDAQKVTFGDASDLQIYHDATNSYIKNNTGKLKLVSADVQLRNAADSGYLAQFDDGGKVKLYHSTTKKFETNSSGVTVFGASNATSFEIDGTTVIDASKNLTNIGTINSGAITANSGGGATVLGSHLDLGDNQKARFGASDDLQIYHDGSDSYIKNGTGDFKMFGAQGTVAITVAGGSGSAVSLEYANSLRLQTTADGVWLPYGASFRSNVVALNYLNAASVNQWAKIGYFRAYNNFQSGLTDGSNFGGLEFYNAKNGTTTGATGYIRGIANGTTGNMNLEIQTGTAGSLTTKMLVKDAGVDVTGNIAVSGTVDGVDIAVRDALLSGVITDKSPIASPTFTGTPAAPTASGSTSTTQLATTAFVQQELTTLIGGAPSTLNDLNELAAAINDDANYNSTLTTALGTKAPLASPTFTSNINVTGSSTLGSTAAPLRTLDSRGSGMAIFGTGGYTEIMLRERSGTLRNTGAWHWSVRGDVGGANDDLKLLRFTGGSYQGVAMQVASSSGAATFSSTVTSTGLTVNSSLITASGDGLLQVASASSALWTAINTGDNGYTSMPSEISVINSLDNTVNSFAGIFFQAGETSSGSQISSARIGAVRTGAFTADLAFATRNSSGVMAERARIASSGAATFSSTVTSPSFVSTAGGTFTTAAGNDLNIVYPATRSLFIKEGSETHLTINNEGRVGIGTTNFVTTGAKLQVKGTSAAPATSGSNFTGSIFSVEGTSTVNISMGTTGASSYDGWVQVHDAGTGTNYDLLLNPLGGNVGIGTSGPAGKLHVYSGDAGTVTPSAQADDLVVEASTEGGITIMTPNDQSARIRFTSPATEAGDEGGADIFYRQNINKMSIGTTVSGGKLAFKSGAGVETLLLDGGNATFAGTAISSSFATKAGGTFTTAAGNDLNIVYPASRSLFIKEGSETHLTIDNIGRVGINRTPAQANSKLEVGGADNVSIIMAEASGATAGIGVRGGGIGLYTGTTSHFMINTSGVAMFGGDVIMNAALSANVISAGIATTIASSSLTATVNTHVYVSVAGKTITLPASPTIGHRVLITVGNFTDTIIGRNGTKIMGSATDLTMDAAYLSIQFIYTDATQGWVMT